MRLVSHRLCVWRRGSIGMFGFVYLALLKTDQNMRREMPGLGKAPGYQSLRGNVRVPDMLASERGITANSHGF